MTMAEAEAAVRDAAIAMVQNDKGVRVEDYLATLAAVTGEGALAAAGFDVAGHGLTPGSGLFFEPVNARLTGDPLVDPVPATSVYGIVAAGATDPPAPTELYEHVARSVGAAEWGQVSLTVTEDNRPWILPIRAAYDLRATVIGIEVAHDLAVGQRHVLTATALRAALDQVAGAIDPVIGVRIALEVTFGMAKMAPMSDAAFASAAADAEPR
jgi:hypothetical protein